MNIIFLDIDDVLVTDRYQNEILKIKDELEIEDVYKFDLICVENLKSILHTTDSKIVISSNWRNKGMNRLKAIFEQYELEDYLISITPYIEENNQHVIRGVEIQSFIDNNKDLFDKERDRFIIIDDGGDMGELMPYLVQINDGNGITREIADEAINLFNSQKSKCNRIGLNILPNQIEKHLNNIEKEK